MPYAYDKLNRLTAVTAPLNSVVRYGYDAVGNPTLKTDELGFTLTRGYDANDRVASSADEKGAVTVYAYDARNRLVAATVTSAAGAVEHAFAATYDVFDRRVGVAADGAAAYTAYDGQNAWADYAAGGAAVARYLPGDRSDELLARWRAADGTAWYLQDRMFSVRDVADLHGVAVDRVEYDAFGAVRSESAPAAGDRYKYTGREYDAATGLYHYRARAYDPAAGRFLQQDPVGFAAGDANLYRYAFNSPTLYRDPSGMTAAVGYALMSTALKFVGDVDVKVCVSDESTRIVFTASLDVRGWGVEATVGFVIAPHGIPVPRTTQMAMCVESCAQLYVTAFANGVFGVVAMALAHFGDAGAVGTEYAEPDAASGLWKLRVSLSCGRRKLQAMADGRGPKPGGGTRR